MLLRATGQVTFNGKPLIDAGVVFSPNDAQSSAILATGRTDESGEFILETNLRHGAAAGAYNVAVFATNERSSPKTPEDMQKLVKTESAKPPQSSIPLKYSNPNESGLSYSVSASGKNRFDIKLTGTAPR
jgi:hypothetical protein